MQLDLRQQREQELVNQIALVFEDGGLPPVAGRIVGRLLLCDPAHQSSTELADYLQASRGSISTSTRMLIQMGLVERVRFPGDRSSYFRIVEGCWTKILEAEHDRFRRLREFGEDATEFLASKPGTSSEALARVEEFRDFSAFFEREVPLLLEHWEQRRDK